MKTTRTRVMTRLAVVALVASSWLLLAADPAPAATWSETIPSTAFLQPADLGGVTTQPADVDLRPALRPPQPGHPDGFRSLAARRANGAITALYPVPGEPPRPTVLVEDIGLYKGAGAWRYMCELRRALSRSDRTDAAGTWVRLDSGLAGRDSLLLRLDATVDIEGSVFVQRTYIIVARIGRAIVVLADIGWETADGHEAIVRALAPAMMQRAATLR